MNRCFAALALAFAGFVLPAGPSRLAAADAPVLFQQDFTRLPAGELPSEFLVLSGLPAVKEEGGNKFVEFPGSPVEDLGFLFGPSEPFGIEISARAFATKQGRRLPTFAAGVNGSGGYKVRVAPGKKAIELVKNESVLKSVPFDWKSGEWTTLKLRTRKLGDGVKVDAKVWQGATEPTEWILSVEEPASLPAGKSGVWGTPYAGTPIRFDDLRVTKVEP